MKKVRTSGVVARVKADPSEMIAVEVPEWRIVNDATFAVGARFSVNQTTEPSSSRRTIERFGHEAC